jgi:DNA-binding transcriptional LysR family regulator
MIEVRLLEHALAVADEGSFALAAQVLGISQPALSRSIQSLEAQLDIQLFERSHRRIEPTDAGQIFLDKARDIIARHEELSHEMGLIQQNQSATFTLAVGPYVADMIASHALARVMETRPPIQYHLRVESWTNAVKLARSREADLAVADVSQLADDPDLELMPLENVQGYFVVRNGHPLLQSPSPSVSQILAYPLVSPSRLPPRIRGPLQQERGERADGFPGGFPAVLCEDVSVMHAIVAQSDVVGMFILPLIERELAAGTLVPLSAEIPWLHTQFGIIRLRNRPLTSHGQQLTRFIEEAAANLAAKNLELARPRRKSG